MVRWMALRFNALSVLAALDSNKSCGPAYDEVDVVVRNELVRL